MKKEMNQKKLKLSKQHKRFFITVIIILFLVDIGLIINEVMKEATTEVSQVASSFSNTPGVSYQVYLKANTLYSNGVQPEDQGFFSALIDHISVAFDNKYQGVNGAEYKGDYTITGEIIGWESGTENPTPAWTKQFVISSKKTFRTTDDKLVLSQDANIDYAHFNTFVAQVGELTGYNTTYSMNVVMAVNYTIATEEGEATGSLHPTLTIPLGEKYFRIMKSGTEEMKNDITEIVEVPVPFDYAKIILFSTFGLLCLILLILLIQTVELTLTDIQRKQVKKIMKAHGNRIVAIEKLLPYNCLEVCNVHSMNDMVKISDEIERPILYVYKKDLSEIEEFFIIEGEKAFLFTISVNESKKPDSEKYMASSESGESNISATA